MRQPRLRMPAAPCLSNLTKNCRGSTPCSSRHSRRGLAHQGTPGVSLHSRRVPAMARRPAPCAKLLNACAELHKLQATSATLPVLKDDTEVQDYCAQKGCRTGCESSATRVLPWLCVLRHVFCQLHAANQILPRLSWDKLCVMCIGGECALLVQRFDGRGGERYPSAKDSCSVRHSVCVCVRSKVECVYIYRVAI